MIVNRFNPLGRNLGKTATHYIQDGLIAHWDAIENVGYGTHDSDSLIWRDLVGGIELTLNGGAVWTKNSLTLDGTGYGIADVDESKWTSVNTVEAVFQKTTSNGGICLALGGGGSMPLMRISPQTIEGRSGFLPRRCRFPSGFENGYSIRSVVRRRNTSFIINGSESEGDNGNWSANRTLNKVSVGVDTDGASFPFTGTLWGFRVYNRVLTLDEANYNLKIDKERFGIVI